MSYRYWEMKSIEWGHDKGITRHSTGLAQAEKTQEELNELVDALKAGDKEARDDAYGDILITLIMGAACEDTDLIVCLEKAYNQIKDRKGWLDADGIFHKEG